MKVYIITYEDNVPGESNHGIMSVYQNIQDARAQLGVDFLDTIKQCDTKDICSDFFDYTVTQEEDYWEIRSMTDSFYYMSESIEEFEVH